MVHSIIRGKQRNSKNSTKNASTLFKIFGSCCQPHVLGSPKHFTSVWTSLKRFSLHFSPICFPSFPPTFPHSICWPMLLLPTGSHTRFCVVFMPSFISVTSPFFHNCGNRLFFHRFQPLKLSFALSNYCQECAAAVDRVWVLEIYPTKGADRQWPFGRARVWPQPGAASRIALLLASSASEMCQTIYLHFWAFQFQIVWPRFFRTFHFIPIFVQFYYFFG